MEIGREREKLEHGNLVIWEPLQVNPFDRFHAPINLVSMHFEGDFVLKFNTFNSSKEYIFTYKQNQSNYYAIRHFRILEEFIRHDIEILIDQFRLKRESLGLPKLTYNHTFFKIENSSFLSWYRSIDPSFPLQEDCCVEHHLYITSNYFIDVLSEQQPTITISTNNDSGNLIE